MAGWGQEQACLRSKAHNNFSSQRLTGYWHNDSRVTDNVSRVTDNVSRVTGKDVL